MTLNDIIFELLLGVKSQLNRRSSILLLKLEIGYTLVNITLDVLTGKAQVPLLRGGYHVELEAVQSDQ